VYVREVYTGFFEDSTLFQNTGPSAPTFLALPGILNERFFGV
jgi:hypothetical protein